MEIKEFIKTTLKQLSEAINEVKAETGKKVMLTNTTLRTSGKGNYGIIGFDLAVEAKASERSGKGAGIRISIAEAKLGKAKEVTSSSISRIQFELEANF